MFHHRIDDVDGENAKCGDHLALSKRGVDAELDRVVVGVVLGAPTNTIQLCVYLELSDRCT